MMSPPTPCRPFSSTSTSTSSDGQEGEEEGERRVVIVGLGNPGRSYAYTRHNAGATVLAALAGTYLEHAHGVRSLPTCASSVLSATVAEYDATYVSPMGGMEKSAPVDAVTAFSSPGRMEEAGRSGVSVPHSLVSLVFPHTYMNRSGLAVAHALKAYEMDLVREKGKGGTLEKEQDHLVVCYDDLNLPLGAIKVQEKKTKSGEKTPHNGLRSVCSKLPLGSAVTRLRVGIGRPLDGSPITEWVLSEFTGQERKALHTVATFTTHVLRVLIHHGVDRAANFANNYTADEFVAAYKRALQERKAYSYVSHQDL